MVRSINKKVRDTCWTRPIKQSLRTKFDSTNKTAEYPALSGIKNLKKQALKNVYARQNIEEVICGLLNPLEPKLFRWPPKNFVAIAAMNVLAKSTCEPRGPEDYLNFEKN